MAAREPWILIDDAAQPLAEFVIGPFPERPEGAGRGHDRIVMDAVFGADLGDAIRHAGAAGDAVDEALGPFEHAMQDGFGRPHLPQHIHMDAAIAVRGLVRHARLMDATGDRVADQLFMPLAPGLAVIDLWDHRAGGIEGVGIDAGEGADAAGCRPGA